MGFSKEIKEKALVASARRCCVCKEFKGRNIEIHHIIPKNQGGEDTFENAIPLCFDCHANAGHYNSKHPKGTKFSPVELKTHRDNWYQLVREGKLNTNSEHITQQFFVANSMDIALEIVGGNMENFPLNEVKLLQNDLSNYLNRLRKKFNNNEDVTNYYKSLKEYRDTYPKAKKVSNEWGGEYWERIPSIEELKEKFFNNHFVVNYMIRNKAEASEIAKAIFNEYGCADGNYETYHLRAVKIVFLSLLNVSNKYKYITEITEIKINDGGFYPLDFDKTFVQKEKINNLLLEPGKCLLIPYCIILSDLNERIEPLEEIIYQHIKTGQSQDIRKIKYFGETTTIGPRHFVKSVEFETDGITEKFIVKKFDPKTLLLISRFWECGSCPHLFAKNNKTNKWEYIGEVFSDHPDLLQSYTKKFDNKLYSVFKVKEIENEITKIDVIYVDKKELITSIKLKKNDEIIFSTNKGKLLEIKGMYSLIDGEKYVKNNKMKLQKILYTLADMNNDTPINSLQTVRSTIV